MKVAVKQLRMVQAKGLRRRVALVRFPTARQKVFLKADHSNQRLARELKVWSSAKHRNILELVGFYLSENLGSAQLISPYMSNGNVKDYIKKSQPAIDIRLQFVGYHLSLLLKRLLTSSLLDYRFKELRQGYIIYTAATRPSAMAI